jgi:hypothetical protein
MATEYRQAEMFDSHRTPDRLPRINAHKTNAYKTNAYKTDSHKTNSSHGTGLNRTSRRDIHLKPFVGLLLNLPSRLGNWRHVL